MSFRSAVPAIALALLAPAVVLSKPLAPHVAPSTPVWALDKAASRLSFKGQVNGQGFDGVFKKWDAQIAFDPKTLKGSRIVVSIDMPSAVTGDPTRDQMLPSGDWFAVQRFPKASFVATQVNPAGPGRYQAIGDVTIKGQTRHVTLPFTLQVVKTVAHMDGALTIDRRQFGVGQGQFAGTDTVAAEVQIMVRLTAKTTP
jgi:polyisoprenoid-binding protein YceI